MPPRFFVDRVLCEGDAFALPEGAARHVQVLRLQPDAPITLFDGRGGEWAARVQRMSRSEVTVRVGAHRVVDRELTLSFTLALGMPANERMDMLVEKATELGVATIQPLHCDRSVLRLKEERALKKVAHWRAVAEAACEQSGRTRLPVIEPVCGLHDWLAALPSADATQRRLLLSLRDAQPLAASSGGAVVCLSGPEGGLTEAEETAARACGFQAVTLGARVLRADTAPLALLAWLGLATGV